MAKGFGGMPGNLKGMMEQAQKLQQQLLKAKEEAEALTYDGSAGGGMVKVQVSGKNRILSIKISPEVVNPDDIEMLQDLIMAATNEALQKAEENMKSSMGKLTGGLSIPGM
jgi:DNA-binding YbaB/EbfC family protein